MDIPKGAERTLAALEEEVKTLEAHIQEVEAAKKTVEGLDAEAVEATKAAERVAEQVEAEQRKKAQIDQKVEAEHAAARDPAALKRTLANLRKRNKALQKLHDTCNGNGVAPRTRSQTRRRRSRRRRCSPSSTRSCRGWSRTGSCTAAS
jgi:DNA repair exonuclease SbcCD ATPase subunit